MSERVDDYRLDLVETALTRAGPDGLDKGELQRATGLGTGDLREALGILQERDWLRERGDRVVLWGGGGEDFEAVGVDPEAAAEEADLMANGQPSAADVEEELTPERLMEDAEPEPVVPTPDSYRARLALDVTFARSAGDVKAIKDAQELLQLAADAIRHEYPDLAVSAAVERVEAFSAPRRVL